MTLYKPLQAVYIKPKWLPVAGLQMFPIRKLRKLTLVQFPSQRNMKLSTYGVKIFKGKTASLNLLFYFETVQKAIVSTAGAEIVKWVNYNRNS